MAVSKHTGGNALYFAFRLVKTALKDKQEMLVFDQAPTKNSENVVTSGAVYQAIDDAMGGLDTILADIVGGE